MKGRWACATCGTLSTSVCGHVSLRNLDRPTVGPPPVIEAAERRAEWAGDALASHGRAGAWRCTLATTAAQERPSDESGSTAGTADGRSSGLGASRGASGSEPGADLDLVTSPTGLHGGFGWHLAIIEGAP